MDLNKPWTEYDFVAFDTETSGAWPVGCDIVEFGAVRWSRGQEVGHLQMLLKPRERMTDFIIGIHGITNEMVADAPVMKDVVHQIADFFKGAVAMAHHAPFDLGFVALEFETYGIAFPEEPVLCTSLLARKLITGVENHKLQTLVKSMGIDGGSAHRALDDARSCLNVGLKCLEKLGPDATLQKAITVQEKPLRWGDYAILSQKNEVFEAIVQAIRQKGTLEFVYDKGTSRQAVPAGLVRNPDGDFMQAFCLKDRVNKRFYVEKIKSAKAIPSVE